MRHITIVGVDPESETVECEIADTGERLALPLDDTFRAAARGEFPADSSSTSVEDDDESASAADTDSAAAAAPSSPASSSTSTPKTGAARAADRRGAKEGVRLRPRDIQDRVRMGATVDELVELTGYSPNRIEAFAYPILQERAARAEKNRLAHPLLGDGPAVETVEAKTLAALDARGIDADLVSWDSWRLKNGNWVVQASWPAGLSEDASAQWECVPDSHGGVAHPLDDEAAAIGDPSLRRPLQAVPQSDGHSGATGGYAAPPLPHDPTSGSQPFMLGRPVAVHQPAQHQPTQPAHSAPTASTGAEPPQAQPTSDQDDDDFLMHPPADGPAKPKGKHPTMPSWEDVLLGVRSPKE